MLRSKRLWVAGAGAYITATAFTYFYFRNKSSKQGTSKADGDNTFDNIAIKYDSSVDFDESLFGIKKKRKSLLSQVSGEVLEISAGTGRNFEYYPTEGVQITLIDTSKQMLKKAVGKKGSRKAKFYEMNAENLQFSDESFDYVVDTFGLCSMDDPVKALREMARVCKKDGKVLLLEHGKASYDWLNKWLDSSAEDHHVNWGCWWNRDMDALVQQAGLEVVDTRRSLFGTNYEYICTPRSSNHQAIAEVKSVEQKELRDGF